MIAKISGEIKLPTQPLKAFVKILPIIGWFAQIYPAQKANIEYYGLFNVPWYEASSDLIVDTQIYTYSELAGGITLAGLELAGVGVTTIPAVGAAAFSSIYAQNSASQLAFENNTRGQWAARLLNSPTFLKALYETYQSKPALPPGVIPIPVPTP